MSYCRVFHTTILSGFLLLPSLADEQLPLSRPMLDGEQMLKQLRERDARLRDAIFRYRKVRTEVKNLLTLVRHEYEVSHAYSQQPPLSIEILTELIQENKPFITAEYECNEILAVRGLTLGCERDGETLTALHSESDVWKRHKDELNQFMHGRSHYRWSNSGGVGQGTNDSIDESYVAVTSTEGGLALLDQQRMATEFSLGFGFGKRLLHIESVEDAGKGTVTVRGDIRVWTDDVSDCVLTVDDEMVVRKAEIYCDVSGNLHEFSISCDGHFTGDADLPMLPLLGAFKKRWVGRQRDGKRSGIPKLVDQFEVELIDLCSPVPDEEFLRLTTFEISSDTIVRDISKSKTLRSPGQVALSAASNPKRNLLLLVNVFFIGIVLLVLLYRGKKEAQNVREVAM